jgi:hypothetical protein
MLSTIAFPTASYLISRAHLLRLLALCLLVAVAVPVIFAAVTILMPLVVALLAAVLPVVAWGVAIFGGMYAGLLAVVRS